jgi:hypothetical protein
MADERRRRPRIATNGNRRILLPLKMMQSKLSLLLGTPRSFAALLKQLL